MVQLLLPRLGEGWDEVFPAKALFFYRHSEQLSKAQRDSESPATLPMRHSVLDTESPASIKCFKLFSPFTICPTMRL